MRGVSSTETKTEPAINQSLGYTETDCSVTVPIEFDGNDSGLFSSPTVTQ